MIKRIDQLRSFGPFKDFSWNSAQLKDFGRYNLIYGWNYSGKTTLSRAFQSVERGLLEHSVSSAKIRFLFDDGTVIDQGNLAPLSTLKVFNRDYVRKNIASESTASAVFILGEDAIRLQQRLTHLRKRTTSFGAEVQRLGTQIRQLELRRDDIGADIAREVARQTQEKAFNRTRLEEVARSLPSPRPPALTEDELSAEVEYVRREGDLTPLRVMLEEQARFVGIANSLNALFKTSPVYKALEELTHSVAHATWVEEGLRLHTDRETCSFCSGPLTAERLASLTGHFSSEFKQLSSRLRELERALQALRLEITIPASVFWSPECRGDLSELNELVDRWNQGIESLRTDLLEKINDKMAEPPSAFSFDEYLPLSQTLDLIKGRVVDVLSRHNQVVQAQEARASRARQRIREHWASVFRGKVEGESILVSIEGMSRRRDRIIALKNLCDIEEARLSVDVSGVRRGAELVSEILASVLGDTMLTASSDGQNGMRFFRGGQVASNLSEGEQTAVTFSHFLASLESGEHDVGKLIVFIDDPISSLDSSNVYSVFGAIQRRLIGVKQLFISTHNSEFFSYLKSFWLQDSKRKQSSQAYFTRRRRNAEMSIESTLEPLPKPLLRFASEYEFIFAELHAFANRANPELGESYASANLLRRFLESYLGFRKPFPVAWSEKLDLLIGDPVRASAIKKFCDDGSHLQSKNRILEHAVFVSSAQSLVREVMEALKFADRPHFDSLCTGLDITQEEVRSTSLPGGEAS